MKFAIYGPNGQITQTCTAPSADCLDGVAPEGFGVCEVGDEVFDNTHFILGKKAVPLPASPGPHHIFNYDLRVWLDSRTEEQLAREARALRDARIAASDWVMLPDVSMEEGLLLRWTAYRQALRDITSQPGFPRSIDWPTKPV